MGKLGRTIDALPRDVKDFLVRDQNWAGAMGASEIDVKDLADPTLEDARACIAGQVIKSGYFGDPDGFLRHGPGRVQTQTGAGRRPNHSSGFHVSLPLEVYQKLQDWGLDDIGPYFDRLCRRFGKERIVQAIKKRAGADLSELEEEKTVPRESPVDKTVPA